MSRSFNNILYFYPHIYQHLVDKKKIPATRQGLEEKKRLLDAAATFTKAAMEDEALLSDPFYLEVGQYLGKQENFTLGGITEYYSEVYGLEMNQGLNEVWHQTFNTQTQGKSIADIVDEQYRNSISIIASYQ